MTINPIATILGTFYPAQPIAEKTMRVILTNCGLDPAGFPIKELAAHSITMAKFRG
jgi:hypothetical protein